MEPFDELAALVPYWGDRLSLLPRPVKERCADVRLKAGWPVSLSGPEGVLFLGEQGRVSRMAGEELPRVTGEEIKEIFLAACGDSVFCRQREIRRGRLRFAGKFRMGFCGEAVTDDQGERLTGLRNLTSLCFRLPRQEIGCGDRLFLEGVPLERGLLLAGPPGSGKTTLLRDVALSLSSGKFGPAARVAVLDEGGELSAFPLGPCADVLLGYPRQAAFSAAISALSPDVLLCDELGTEDLPSLRRAVFSGPAVIAAVHASPRDFLSRPLCRALLETGAFGTLVLLTGRERPGEIAQILPWGEGP